MPRPDAALPSVIAQLREVVVGERPAWCSEETWRRCIEAVEAVSRDMSAVIEAQGPMQAKTVFSVGRGSLHRWSTWLGKPIVPPSK